MRIRIIRERRFMPPEHRNRVTVHYTPGLELTVKRAWGAALVANGDAVEIPAPKRQPKPEG